MASSLESTGIIVSFSSCVGFLCGGKSTVVGSMSVKDILLSASFSSSGRMPSRCSAWESWFFSVPLDVSSLSSG